MDILRIMIRSMVDLGVYPSTSSEISTSDVDQPRSTFGNSLIGIRRSRHNAEMGNRAY